MSKVDNAGDKTKAASPELVRAHWEIARESSGNLDEVFGFCASALLKQDCFAGTPTGGGGQQIRDERVDQTMSLRTQASWLLAKKRL